MKINKDLNDLTESEFISIFGCIFEKSKWIAVQTFKQKPFKDSQDLMNKMLNIYESCSIDKITKILNSHPKLAIEKKLTSLSLKEQKEAKLDQCSDEEILEFEKLNLDYEKKFMFPFIIAVKGKNKNEILVNFRKRIQNDLNKEFFEAKNQVKKIASLRLKDILSI